VHWGTTVDARYLTTPAGQLEALRTTDPINLGWDLVCELDRMTFCSRDADCPGEQRCVTSSPELSFKHQVSLMDHRVVNTRRDRTTERAIVQAQLANESGDPIGDWIKLEPFVNVYDSVAESYYMHCTFDPIDDGSDEGDFFDPSDPLRYLGPSSTCEPELSFAHQGDTDYWFSGSELGDASDGPGLRGSQGWGTWVEPRFDLERFRGQRLRFRFLATGLKVDNIVTWHGVLQSWGAALEADDGWFIDDVTVTDTLSQPATLVPDLKDNSSLPGCGVTCGAVTADAIVVPASSLFPGQAIEIDASASRVDRCVDGVLEYRFSIDLDRNGKVNRADVVLRDWTQNALFRDSPHGDSSYLVEARCATDRACADGAVVSVQVGCPMGPGGLGSGSERLPFLGREPPARRSIVFSGDASTISWSSAATVDVVRGPLMGLRATGDYVDTTNQCLTNNAAGSTSLIDAEIPPPGQGWYYLARSASHCNLTAGGTYGSPARDSGITACPE
jgi:hypothetical protein